MFIKTRERGKWKKSEIQTGIYRERHLQCVYIVRVLKKLNLYSALWSLHSSLNQRFSTHHAAKNDMLPVLFMVFEKKEINKYTIMHMFKSVYLKELNSK